MGESRSEEEKHREHVTMTIRGSCGVDGRVTTQAGSYHFVKTQCRFFFFFPLVKLREYCVQ